MQMNIIMLPPGVLPSTIVRPAPLHAYLLASFEQAHQQQRGSIGGGEELSSSC